jgi:hypothetical protein
LPYWYYPSYYSTYDPSYYYPSSYYPSYDTSAYDQPYSGSYYDQSYSSTYNPPSYPTQYGGRQAQPLPPSPQAPGSYQPAAPDAGAGQLAVRVQPGDATILIDGEAWHSAAGGDRLLVNLTAGQHQVEIRKDGYDAFVTTVEVRRGETAALNVSLSKL